MVSIGSIVRGALSRTLPGVLGGFGALIAVSAYSHTTTITLAKLAFTVTASLAAAAGSAAVLLLLRRRLRADAGVTGRRALLVGLGSFGVVIVARPFLSGLGNAGEHLLMAASGATLAAAVFFPWLASAAAGGAEPTLDTPAPRSLAAPDALNTLIPQRGREQSVLDRDPDA